MISHFWLGSFTFAKCFDLRQPDANLCQSFALRTYFVFVSHLFFRA